MLRGGLAPWAHPRPWPLADAISLAASRWPWPVVPIPYTWRRVRTFGPTCTGSHRAPGLSTALPPAPTLRQPPRIASSSVRSGCCTAPSCRHTPSRAFCPATPWQACATLREGLGLLSIVGANGCPHGPMQVAWQGLRRPGRQLQRGEGGRHIAVERCSCPGGGSAGAGLVGWGTGRARAKR